ncbi:VUT family protein [Endozoicomonas acroporae]|uniref:VUT family protein n=1 Tax=Endozoicomonas acroporae TaxID=1701104 RepID=UPI0015E15358|nr:VUT family protein [Endozoicomonas acroporae]
MKLKAYNRSKDEVVIIDSHGNVSERGIKRFIRSGQDNDLPPEDREVLLQQLEGRTDIIADKGLNGGHCFSLPCDQPLLNYLWGVYIGTIILCPVLFLIHFGWFGVDFTVAPLVFPLSFAFLNPVSELYGQRSARRLLNNTVLILLALAGFSWLLLNLPMFFDHSGFSHDYDIASVVSV